MSTARVKDAGFLQQHIEKVVLGVGILIFLLTILLFVIGNPYAVTVSNQTYAEPDEAVEVLSMSNNRLKRGLADDESLPEPITPDFLENIIAMLDRDISSDFTPRYSDRGLTNEATYPPKADPQRYALVYPPAPKNVQYKNGTDVLDVQFNPQLAQQFFELWGKEPGANADFTMFIASGEFDVWEWVTRLKADPKLADHIKIPTGVWLQRFGIAGVALLREEWDPNESEWIDRHIVAPMPGQSRVMPTDTAPTTTTDAIEWVKNLRESQLEIAQPELPWLAGFVQAVPPGGEELGEGADAVGGFFQAINEENLGPAEKRILQLQEKIQGLEKRREERNKRRGAGPDAGGPGDFADPGPGGGERRDPFAPQIERLQEQIQRLEDQANKERENRERLEELKRQREEQRRAQEARLGNRDIPGIGLPDNEFGGVGAEGLELKEGATVRVWAADPTMRPGKTYRYKLLVSVINPLYAVTRLEPDQLKDNRDKAAIMPTEREIENMEWIGPVKVEPESRFFFTNGGDNRAKVEIFRRVNGELRKQTFDATPGDRLGGSMEVENNLGIKQRIDMSVNADLIDVSKRRDVFRGGYVYTMVYMDSEGNLYERIDQSDKSSAVRKKLNAEIEKGPEHILRPPLDAAPGDGFGPDRFGAGERF